MKRKQLLAFIAAGLILATPLSLTGKALAHGDGAEDEVEDQAAPVNSPSSDDSSSNISSQATKVEVTNSLKQIEKVEIDTAKSNRPTSLLTDDTSSKTVVLRVRNGKVIRIIKSEDALGVPTESEFEFEPRDSIVVLGHDSSGNDSRITIKFHDGHFELEQAGLKVTSNFPVSISSLSNTISIVTPAGQVAMHGLPVAAINQLKQKHLFANFDSIEIEDENALKNVNSPEDVAVSSESKTPPISEKIVFKISGNKAVKLFGLIPLHAPVTIKLAPDTGTAAITSKPWYLSWLGFLFSNS